VRCHRDSGKGAHPVAPELIARPVARDPEFIQHPRRNGVHQKNSAGIAKFFINWIKKNIRRARLFFDCGFWPTQSVDLMRV